MWTKEDIPDQTGKTVIITGANTGIGYETARALYESGAHVVLACRDIKKAQDAILRLKLHMGRGTLEAGALDLADLDSVKNFADGFIHNKKRLDLLINNAGVALPPLTKTAQGYELQFGVNFLGHFALTGRLYPLLKATAGSRVITLTSMGYQGAVIDFVNLKSENSYDAMREYRQSKLADLLFATEFDRRVKHKGDTVLSIIAQPGANKTELTRHLSEEAIAVGKERIGAFMEPWQGALCTLYAAVSPEASGGKMYEPDEGGYRGYPGPAKIKENGLDEAGAHKLWQLGEDITGLNYP